MSNAKTTHPDRYVLIYDGEQTNDAFKTHNLQAAIDAAIKDYEYGGYDTIEIFDSVENRIIWAIR